MTPRDQRPAPIPAPHLGERQEDCPHYAACFKAASAADWPAMTCGRCLAFTAGPEAVDVSKLALSRRTRKGGRRQRGWLQPRVAELYARVVGENRATRERDWAELHRLVHATRNAIAAQDECAAAFRPPLDLDDVDSTMDTFLAARWSAAVPRAEEQELGERNLKIVRRGAIGVAREYLVTLLEMVTSTELEAVRNELARAIAQNERAFVLDCVEEVVRRGGVAVGVSREVVVARRFLLSPVGPVPKALAPLDLAIEAGARYLPDPVIAGALNITETQVRVRRTRAQAKGGG